MLYGCGNKIWVPLLRLWGVVNYAFILVCRQYASEQFTPVMYCLSQLEFAYGDPRYVAQLVELSKLWGEPQQVKFARQNYDVAPRYLECKSIRVNDAVLSEKDNSVQSADLLPKRMSIEVEILRRELKIEKKKKYRSGSPISGRFGAMSVLSENTRGQSKKREKRAGATTLEFQKAGSQEQKVRRRVKRQGR